MLSELCPYAISLGSNPHAPGYSINSAISAHGCKKITPIFL